MRRALVLAASVVLASPVAAQTEPVGWASEDRLLIILVACSVLFALGLIAGRR